MKNYKKLLAVITAIGILGAAGAVYAAASKTPAEIASGLTGKSIEEVNTERASGKTYGTMAKEAGKLDEFKSQMLEQKKAILDQKVKDGIMTQERADEIYNALKSNMANCDGTGNSGIGRKYGAGFGQGNGKGCGKGQGRGVCGGGGCTMGTGSGMNR